MKFVTKGKSSKPSPKSAAQRLTALRKAMGLSMREFAKEFHVTHTSISQWESGEYSVPGPAMKLIEIYEQNFKPKKK